MGLRHTYPVNRKDHYHLKVVEQEGVANCKSEIIIGEKLITSTQHSQS